MRIVVGATEHPLPVVNGMRLHLASLLTVLSRRHEIILVTLCRDGDVVDGSLHTERWCAERLCAEHVAVPAPAPTLARRVAIECAALPRRRAIIVETTLRSGLPQAVRAAVARTRPDVVHLQTGSCAAFARSLRPTPTVVVPLDADDLNAAAIIRRTTNPLRRLLAVREAARWREFERTAYADCDALVVVSERDADVLRQRDPRLRPHVVPNGVDAAHFSPTDTPRNPATVLLTGAMDYPPNIDAAIFAATEVMPRLAARRPGVRLVLAGRDPAPAVRALAGPNVTVTGTLADLRPDLRRAGAYLCPMRLGSGVKNKLLEALATGCPTVATTLATAGLGVADGRELLVGDSAEHLAAALDRVLGDPALAAALSRDARRRALMLSWETAAARFVGIYAEVVTGARR